MRPWSALFLSMAFAAGSAAATSAPTALVIHGGAGVITRDQLSPADETALRADLDRALDAGDAVLKRGGTALDAVTAAVQVLEDSPWFNAGKGAVFTADGTHELDAAIMEGHPRAARPKPRPGGAGLKQHGPLAHPQPPLDRPERGRTGLAHRS